MVMFFFNAICDYELCCVQGFINIQGLAMPTVLIFIYMSHCIDICLIHSGFM